MLAIAQSPRVVAIAAAGKAIKVTAPSSDSARPKPFSRSAPSPRNAKNDWKETWLAARLELLKAEQELTLRSGELVRLRQELPCFRIEKE